MKRVLLLGANGLFASHFLAYAKGRGDLLLMAQSRQTGWDYQADPTRIDDLSSLIAKTNPEAILNFIGAADVDRCEADPQWAYRGNVAVNEALATCLKQNPVPVIFISTDAMYDGPGANREDQIRPRNVYSNTKLQGERAVESLPHTILRTNFFGRSRTTKATLSDWWIRACREKRFVHVISDGTFSAIHMTTLSRGVSKVLSNPVTGIFNFGTSDVVKKKDFLFCLSEKMSLPAPPHELLLSNDLPGRAPRGVGLGMDSDRFAQTFYFQLPTMEEELEQIVRDEKGD